MTENVKNDRCGIGSTGPSVVRTRGAAFGLQKQTSCINARGWKNANPRHKFLQPNSCASGRWEPAELSGSSSICQQRASKSRVELTLVLLLLTLAAGCATAPRPEQTG